MKNSITPIQQFSYTQGKNATDSAMIIDAMDILYTQEVDGFCIVSSDSDFTRLVSRLRESGKIVIGMGENKTPEPFRKACDKFTILENLLNEQAPGTAQGSGDSIKKEKIEEDIIKMILENQDNNKTTGLGEVGSRLVSLHPDFDVRSYGYNMLSKFLDKCLLQIVKASGASGIELSTLGNRAYEKFKDFKINDYGYSQFNKYIKSIDHIQVKRAGTILIAKYKE